jgi:hypothetical protein
MFFCELNEIKSLAQQLQPCPSDLNKDYPGPNSDFIWPEAKALLCLKTQPQIKKPKKKSQHLSLFCKFGLSLHMTGFADPVAPFMTRLV